LWLPGDEGMGEYRVTANRYEVSFGGDENILKLDSSEWLCTTL